MIDDNNNPLFYETLELTIEADKIEEMPPFILDVYDKDLISDDFIARSVIKVKDASFSED